MRTLFWITILCIKKVWILTYWFDHSNVHGNKLNGTVPLAFQKLESMTYLWVPLASINFLKFGWIWYIFIILLWSRQFTLYHDCVGTYPPTISGAPFPLSSLVLEIWTLCKFCIHLLNKYALILRISKTILTQYMNCWDSDLSNNRITGDMPSSLGDLEHLLKLWVINILVFSCVISFYNWVSLPLCSNLSSNYLTGDIPAEFGNLRSIMEM